MKFSEYVDKVEHLIGAYRVGALKEDELLTAIAELDLECDAIKNRRIDILYPPE